MKKFRKCWNEEKNQWLIAHKDINRQIAYKLFLEAYPGTDISEVAFYNQRSRLGATNYKIIHGSTHCRPLYSEHEKKGYLFIKIAQPNVWISKGRWIYQEYNPGYVYQEKDNFIFLDGNIRNFHPDNIAVVNNKLMPAFQHAGGVVKGDPEATKLHIIQAKLKIAMLDAGEKSGLVYQIGKTKTNRVFKDKQKNYYETVLKPRNQSPEGRKRISENGKKRRAEFKINHPDLYAAKLRKDRERYRQKREKMKGGEK